MQAPLVDIPPGGYDEWFAGKSRNFRQQARSRSREFVRRGGCFVPADSEAEMIDALRDFQRLHLSRWSSRGGSQALRPGVLEMLEQASVELGPDRMQIWTAQVDGTAVASALFVGAGHELHYWLGGFDEEWAALSLSLLLLVEAVRHAAAKGYHRVSFGPGAQDYKYRLATGEDRLDWLDLLPVGRRYPYVRAIQLPSRLRQFAVRRTPPEVKQRIRSGVGRVLGRDRPAESGSDG